MGIAVGSFDGHRGFCVLFLALAMMAGCTSRQDRPTTQPSVPSPASTRPVAPPVSTPRLSAPPVNPGVGRLPASVTVAPGETFFEMETILGDRFVFKLTDATRIKQARDIIEKKLPKRIVGRIALKSEPYNRPWHFVLEPASVEFTYLTDTECDAAIQYVEEHLQDIPERLLPNNRWCPLSSRLVRELLPADSASHGGVTPVGATPKP